MGIISDELLDHLAKRVGRVIEDERKRLNLTQEELADRLGVSQNAVTNWERAAGHGALHLGTILALEATFGLDQSAILKRMGLMSSVPDMEAVILANVKLSGEQKDALIRLYRVMSVA